MIKALERILCAEDDQDIQKIMTVSLEKVGGFTLRICDSGQQLLDERAEFKPDLILLDVMMPGMDGPQTLRRLHLQSPTADVPVIFITAKSQAADVQRLTTLGAIGLIPKPFDPMTLAEHIRRIWNQHHNDRN